MRFYDVLKRKNLLIGSQNDAVIFDASAIAGEIDKLESPAEGKSYPRSSYGVCSPPFANRWFVVESQTVPDPANYTEVDYARDGIKFDMERGDIDSALAKMKSALVGRLALCYATSYDGHGQQYERDTNEHYENGRWLMKVTGFFTIAYDGNMAQSDIIDLRAWAYVVIGRDGTLLSDPEKVTCEIIGDADDLEIAKFYAGGVTNMLPFTMLSLSFLHRRTEVEHIQPNHMTRKKAARAFGEKRGSAELADYYIVRVKPHNERERSLNDMTDILPLTGKKRRGKRSHSVRGHFRRVGEGGLFGRGQYANELLWIPDHARGSGTKIEHDYKIMP